MCAICKAEGAIFDEVARVALENREDNHNKHYTISVEPIDGMYRVMARYGPIGKWVKSQEKNRVGSLEEAKSIMRDLAQKKMHSRGYSYRRCE